MDNESFFKMPKVLFTDEYKDLSAEAKLLYGLMLDRISHFLIFSFISHSSC